MISKLRPRLTYANVVAKLALFLALTGGTAVALTGSNTVFSDDITNNEVRTADVRNDNLTGGGLTSRDVRTNALTGSDVSALTGGDVNDNSLTSKDVSALTGADVNDDSLTSSDVRDDNLSDGGLTANDLRDGSVGASEIQANSIEGDQKVGQELALLLNSPPSSGEVGRLILTTGGLALERVTHTPTGSSADLKGFLDTRGFVNLKEIADPGNPQPDRARIYVRDNGSGVTQLVVRFADGDIDILGQEVP